MCSRITGLLRDAAYASAFGTTGAFSAFVVAFTIPNIFRRVFGEGALSEAFVPLFNEKLEQDGKPSAFRFLSTVLTLTAAALVAVVVLGVIVCLVLQPLFPNGHANTTLRLLPVMLPYTLFICLFGLLCGVLNSFRHFAMPALAPILLNVVLIIATLFVCPRLGTQPDEQLFGLAVAVVVAGILQLAILLPVLRRFGFVLTRVKGLLTPDIRRLSKLMVPGIVGASIYQINVMCDRILALSLESWAAAALFYSERLVYLPVGVFAVALSAASLPLMSRAVAAGRQEEVVDAIGYGLRHVIFLSVPCVLVLMMLGQEVITLLFGRGSFDDASLRQTFAALLFYVPGIPAFAAVKIVRAGFYSHQDMKTPVKVGVFCLILNIVLSLILMDPLGHRGLALSTTIAAWVNVLVLGFLLCRRLRPPAAALRPVVLSVLRVIAAAVAAGFLIAYFKPIVVAEFFSDAITLVISLVAASVTYLAVLTVLSGREPFELIAVVRRKTR
jgi:putative peptidoglycan lipid II flippase